MGVGERIKARRKEIGLSAEQVAKELGKKITELVVASSVTIKEAMDLSFGSESR